MLLAEDILAHSEEQVLNCNIPDTVDDVAFENQDEEAAAMNESPSGVGRGTSFWSLLLLLSNLPVQEKLYEFCCLESKLAYPTHMYRI